MKFRLKDICRINVHALPENTPAQYKFKYIDIGAVDSSGSIEVPTESTSFGAAPSRARRVAPPGAVVVSTVRTYLRAIATVPSSEEPLVFSTGFSTLEPKPVCDGRFLGFLCRSQEFIDSVVSRSVGVSYPAINPSELATVPVHLPPLEEQRRIADFLDAETSRIDKLSSLQSSVLTKLENRETAQRDIAIDGLAADGKTVPLRRFVWSVDQGSSPQCDAIPAAEGEWGVLKVSCLRPGRFIPEQNKRLPDDATPQLSSEVRAGDLLITRANTPQLVGSTAVVGDVRERLLLSDKIFRVQLTGQLLPEFVAEVASGTRIRALCAASSNGASQSMANIRFEEVKAWPMPLVDTREQARFVEDMSETRRNLESLRQRIGRQLTLLAERRQALITAAVTGQFDVSTASGRNTTQGV
ncbi:restriction endonuclease subunit S [Nocardia thailandica]